ncbi:MAG TPA: hypothetical protein PKC39_08280 [Ferruginibacter sp.]|nr:hypothetical protein [Ferruginibacter sp.]HMP20939.1 hypothetical protein [Ferruginibacter sp.]
MKSKIEIGVAVVSQKYGKGVITKIITKSTGYVEVNFNGSLKKEMAFNLMDENGQPLKSKPVHKPLTEEQKVKADRSHAKFTSEMNNATLRANFLDCQIKTGNYNSNLIN